MRSFLKAFVWLGSAFMVLSGSCNLYAQHKLWCTIRGTVVNHTDKTPLESAVIKVFSADSILVAGTIANRAGDFILILDNPGKYELKISFIGFRNVYRTIELKGDSRAEDIGKIMMEEGLVLKSLEIKEDPVAVRVTRDTVEFNAAAYKTTPDATVENLIKKLPGMQVDSKGNIQAVGEKVVKVTVDGRDFFGSDLRIATQNLPADAIAKVQLIDDQTDQAKSTGIDDGKRRKVINLVLKEDKKQGWFGNSSIAGGSTDRYFGSLSANKFTKDKQLNFLLGSNNVSQGFSNQDATAFAGSSSGTTISNGGSVSRAIGGISVGNLSGLSQTSLGGINYSGAFGKKGVFKFSGSYFGATTNTNRLTEQDCQNIQPNGIYLNKSINNGNDKVISHHFNAKMTGMIDSLTSFTFNPTITVNSTERTQSVRSMQSFSTGQQLNATWGNSRMNSNQPSFSGILSLSRKLKNKNGTISLFITTNLSSNFSYSMDQDTNYFYQNALFRGYDRNTDLNGHTDVLTAVNTINRYITDSRKTSLFLTSGVSISYLSSTRATFAYDPVTGLYQAIIDSLSTGLNNLINRYTMTLGFNHVTQKWTFTLSSLAQYTLLDGDVKNPQLSENVARKYFNLLPQAVITYHPKNAVSWSFNLGESVNPPSIYNLTVLQNNPDPLFITQGNPDLLPLKYIDSRIQFSSSNAKRNSFSNVSLYFNKAIDQVAQSTVYNTTTGVTVSKPVNVNGIYNVYIVGSFSVPNKIKSLRLNLGFLAQNSRYVNFVNGIENVTLGLNVSANFTLSYACKEILNLTFNNNIGYSSATNSVGIGATKYLSIENGLDFSYQPIKNWGFKTVANFKSYADQRVSLINTGIQRFFTEKKQLSVELWGFDLVNRNSDINRRSVVDNHIIDTRTNSLHRYFYLKLVYKVNKIGNK